MNPAALKTNIGDLPAGGALIVNSDAFTQQNLNKAGYASNPLTDGSLKPYTRLRGPDLDPQRARARRPRHDQQAEGPDQELLRPRADVLALRAQPWSRRSAGSTRSFGAARSSPRRTSGRSRRATRSARRPRSFHTHYRVRPAKLDAGHVPQHHRQRGDRARLPGRVTPGRSPAVLRLVSDHARPRTSSTSCRATRTSGSRRSRPRTRSPPSARRSGPRTAARWR